MTILHKEEQPKSLIEVYSESNRCVDCGYNTFPGAPPRELAEFLINHDGTLPITITTDCKNYMARAALWEQAGIKPYGGSLCIGCLERRVGRRLKPKDFPPHPFSGPEIPCTPRLRDRRG